MTVSGTVTIGMPVYNAGCRLRAAIDSIVSQTHRDLEIIISDNASTDETAAICQEYAQRDRRVRYVRQPANIGASANFRFVFEAATSEYFLWAAADDIRSADFIELNLEFLSRHPDFLGSTCPVRYSDCEFNESRMGDFALAADDPYMRIQAFFQGWHANGRFYSLFRREALTSWVASGADFLGSDWTLITHLAKQGKLGRVSSGWMELGTHGASSGDIFAQYRKGIADWIFPFRKLACDTRRLMRDAGLWAKCVVFFAIARLNIRAVYLQFDVILRDLRRKIGRK